MNGIGVWLSEGSGWTISSTDEHYINVVAYDPLRGNSYIPLPAELRNGKKSLITAVFTNMRILKLKSQLTIAFFAAVNHLNGPLRKQNFTLTGSKGHGL